MREPALLILNCIDVARVRSEKVILKVRKELLYFKPKNPGNQIWPVRRLLAWQEFTDNLRPLRVSCKGQKEGWFPKETDNSHRVLEELLHKAIPASKRRWEDKATAKVCGRDVRTDQRIS